MFVRFENCSFHDSFHLYSPNYLLSSGYNITHVLFIQCTFDIPRLIRGMFIGVSYVESQIHIVQSNVIHANFQVTVRDYITSNVSSVAHVTVHDSIINDTSINIMTLASVAVGIVQITNTILTHTEVTSEEKYIIGYKIDGYTFKSVQTAFFIDNCTFIQSSLHSPRSIIVYIVNSKFDVDCQTKGCALTLTGTNDVDMDISHINVVCKLFQIKMCHGIYLSNIDFISTESEAEFLTIEGNQTIIENCTFSISPFVPIYVRQNMIFEDHSKIIHLINVKVDVTEVNRSLDDIPLFSINTAELISQNVLLF